MPVPERRIKMSIMFKKVIMHTLDASLDMPLLSKECLNLTDDTEAYITSYVVGLFENHSMAKAAFEDSSPWLEVIQSGIKDFYSFSCDMAHQFFAYLQTFENIPSGDLIVTQFERDAIPYAAFIKLNYKEAFTHAMDHSIECNQIIKHKNIFPETSSKVQEAAIINLETLNILLLDIHKEKYVHTLLGCTAPLSTKRKIDVVEKVIAEAIEENFENKIEALSFAKISLAKSIESTSSIMIEDVLHETFGDKEEIINACMDILEEQGITEEAIELQQVYKVGKKYTTHKLKTNTGIEIKLPVQILNDPDAIEIITNPNGMVEVRLKNIATLISK